MRISPPDGGLSLFDYDPEVFAAFNEFYGALWTDGVVDQPTKEVGRLRNANIVDCGIWKNLRFAGAKQQGLTEDLVAQVAGGEPTSTLPDRYRLVVRYTDALVGDPNSVTDELRAELAREFSPEQIVELTATITFASGFSKAAIAWGPPPEMPVMDVPSPGPGRNTAQL